MTDYEKQRAEEVARGERCSRCGRLTTLHFLGPHKPRLCCQCEALALPMKCFHGKLIRCPECQGTFKPDDYQIFDVFYGGMHEIECPLCRYKFEVLTSVSYSFESPVLNLNSNPQESS